MMMNYLLEFQRWSCLIGIAGVIAVALLVSRARRAIRVRTVGAAALLLILVAAALLRTTVGYRAVAVVAAGAAELYRCAGLGIEFVFGSLAQSSGASGFIFAVAVLPVIIVFAALMTVLSYLGVVGRIVSSVHYLLHPLLQTDGPATACAIANSFLGQTEAPLLITSYLPTLSRSALFIVMVSGMGTISGAILLVYAALGIPTVHLLTASVMAIPSTILISSLMEPEVDDGTAHAQGDTHQLQISTGNAYSGVLHALTQGALNGLAMALNVGAMLIAFISLLALIDIALGVMSVSLAQLLGWGGLPAAWSLGFRGETMYRMGEIIGLKVAVNEMIAYRALLGATHDGRIMALMTYALCGFSNLSSIGIQIGGIGGLIPERKPLLAELAPRAVLGGVLANLLSAYVAGLLL